MVNVTACSRVHQLLQAWCMLGLSLGHCKIAPWCRNINNGSPCAGCLPSHQGVSSWWYHHGLYLFMMVPPQILAQHHIPSRVESSHISVHSVTRNSDCAGSTTIFSAVRAYSAPATGLVHVWVAPSRPQHSPAMHPRGIVSRSLSSRRCWLDPPCCYLSELNSCICRALASSHHYCTICWRQ